MNKVVVTQLKKIDVAHYRKRSAVDGDTGEIIKKDTIWTDSNGLPLAAYVKIDPAKLSGLRSALQKIKFTEGPRTQGMISRSRIFGYSPRLQVKNLACRLTSLGVQQPEPHAEICRAGKIAYDQYLSVNPSLAQRHMEITDEKVLQLWKIHETPFTSGIANHNNPLLYHYDTGNYKGVWSAMFVLKSSVTGGHLSIPELDSRLECSDCTLVLFDGQSLLHGVTPIKKESPKGYRYSVVYYSLQNMWHCETITDELLKMRETRTKIEFSRATKTNARKREKQ